MTKEGKKQSNHGRETLNCEGRETGTNEGKILIDERENESTFGGETEKKTEGKQLKSRIYIVYM